METTDDTPLLGVVTPPPANVNTSAPAPVDDTPERVKVLREAASLITGDRQQDYGPPEVNFQRIADLWNVQAGHLLKDDATFSPVDVALLLLQLKMARAVQSPKRDTFVDAAGYAGIAAELSEGDR
jgi:hypothetical protein